MSRPDSGWLPQVWDELVESFHLPFDGRWHRPGPPGRHRLVYWLAAAVLVAVAALSLVRSVGWRWFEPQVMAFAVVWWSLLIAATVVIGRALCLGAWTGRGGIRIEWLFHREIIPWSRVKATWVVPSPISFGGRIERLVIETTAGEHVTVRGTDTYLHVLFGAASPHAVRHALERERRFHARGTLPRRRSSAGRSDADEQPVVDLRDPARSAPSPDPVT